MNNSLSGETFTSTMQAIRCEDLEKSLIPKCMLGMYPPLPASPPGELDDELRLYSRIEFMDESIWMFNIFQLYRTSTDIRRANDLRLAFEIGSYKPVSLKDLTARVKMIQDSHSKEKKSLEWISSHITILLNAKFLSL